MLAVSFCVVPTILAAENVDVTRTKFNSLPSTLFYFVDSSVILTFNQHDGIVWRSEDDGKHWNKIDDFKEMVIDIMPHPFDNEKAAVFSSGKTHWVTSNRGKSWEIFQAPLPVSFQQSRMTFNAKNTKYVLYMGIHCEELLLERICFHKTYYTKDWFESDMKLLRENTYGCVFARGSEHFSAASDSTVLCIVEGKNMNAENRILVVTEDFSTFDEPALNGYNKVRGLAGLASVSKFLVAAVRPLGTDHMSLFVSVDAVHWEQAQFPHDQGGFKEDAYTILESTPYSIQVDVKSMKDVGSLFTSNSDGVNFSRNLNDTNRDRGGLVDFEQVKGIEGIILSNVVINANDVQRGLKKQIKSQISFDDGKMGTWKSLKAGKETLHLHSVSELANGGRVHSTSAPGILLGIGNIGDSLGNYFSGDMYISDDAGLSWNMTLPQPHKYAVGGSGSLIVAIVDDKIGHSGKIVFSKDHGQNWQEASLGVDINARVLITTPDATGLNFLIAGTTKDHEIYYINVDFNNVFQRECKLNKEDPTKSDYEMWYARYDDDGKPDCLMGRKQFFYRRKKDADCKPSADKLYKEPDPEIEVCECQEQDFECDFNFIRGADMKCVPAPNAKLPIPPGECKNPKDKYKSPAGYRKIPGNSCKGGLKKDEETVERDCSQAISTPSTGKIVSVPNKFSGTSPTRYFYLDTPELTIMPKETIFMMTDKQEIHVSHNHGKTWARILEDVKPLDIYLHPYHYDTVYFVSLSLELYYTKDRGISGHYTKIKVPSLPNQQGLPYLEFHPTKPGWLIWHGQKDCTSVFNCHTSSYYTTTAGDEWHALKAYSGACKWFRGEHKATNHKLIFCEHEPKEGEFSTNGMQLLSSTNFFVDETVHFERIKGYATMQEFIVVASIEEDNYLKASASVDGRTFADAHFPYGFDVPHQTAYTVLDSDTHSVFLHVTVNSQRGFEHGRLLKSNSNGTDYVVSLECVNRNEEGYVDFEKIHSLEGVILANRVVNPDTGELKKLRTMISHNDGGEWRFITPPKVDSEGNPYPCEHKTDECTLNLHHFTERADARHTFASGSAVGLMMGVGNVGVSLTSFSKGNTFLTTDGGVTWKEVRKGQYFWEYGDQGSIIVIVDRARATDTVIYTLDEGASWQEYKFGERMVVTDISTVPADNSRRFLLWGKRDDDTDSFHTVYLDFEGITNQQCILNKENPSASDFLLWSPWGKSIEGHDLCLFGHERKYYRKIPSHRCYVGTKLNHSDTEIIRNCTCVAQDYECDFNYYRASDNTCQKVDGLETPDHSAQCEVPGTIEYWLPTGYRRLPMTTCQGGNQLDQRESRPCPGKEEEYFKKHRGLGAFGIFFVIVLSIAGAAGVGYYVWAVMGGRFGAIRLGEENENALVHYPIIVISAIIALAMAIPSILSALGRWAGGKFTRTRRYTTTSSLARGDYSVVMNDSNTLLGSSDEDDV